MAKRKPRRAADLADLPPEDPDRKRKLEDTAHLYRRGWTQSEIAAHFKVTQKTVSGWLAEVRRYWKEAMVWELDEYVAEKLDQYREIRKEAWAAWERSKQEFKRTVVEMGRKAVAPPKLGEGPNGRREKPAGPGAEAQMVRLKKTLTREGKVPAVQFLQVVMETLDAERRLLGLDAPKREEGAGSKAADAGWDWSKFTDQAGEAHRLAMAGRTGCESVIALMEAAERDLQALESDTAARRGDQ